MLRTRLMDARGSALVPALLVTSILLAFGMASMAMVEGDQADSRRERERESSFQLAEGVLNAQIYRLSTRWPAKDQTPFPSECNATSTAPDCPGGTSLQANFKGPDYDRPSEWKVQVRDNKDGTDGSYYSDAIMDEEPRDTNGDGFVWVRAEAEVAGRPRVLVALVEAENVTLNFPRAAVVAGSFQTSNSGMQLIIDTNGTSNEWTPAGDVIVRCDLAAPGCAEYEHSGKKQQVQPPTVRSNPAQPKAVSPEALDQLRARAKAEGNYHQGCPPTLSTNPAAGTVAPGGLQGRSGPGGLVFIEDATGCMFNGNNDYNTPEKPGYVVIARGMPTLNGTAEFYGVIYHANEDERSGTLIKLTGTISVVGAIVIDGAGGLSAGSSGLNLVYNPNVFEGLTAFGTAGIVQNTFREINGV